LNAAAPRGDSDLAIFAWPCAAPSVMMKNNLDLPRRTPMRTRTMGKVLVTATVENLSDLYDVAKGTGKQEEVRRVEIPEALVDAGATFLSMPRRYIQQLGLLQFRTRQAKTSGGIVSFGMYSAVRLTVQGRDCIVEVTEVADDCPVLIGQIPLEALDFVVDPVGQRLIGNPDHGGEHMMDMY
jgi:predicted aspartyl protease